MEFLLYFINSEFFGYSLVGGFGVGVIHVASLKERSLASGKVRSSSIKKVSLSEIFKKKNLKLIFFKLSSRGLIIFSIAFVIVFFKELVRDFFQYTRQEAGPIWLFYLVAIFFVSGLLVINYYVSPNQKDLKDVKSRLDELEKSSTKSS